MEHRDNRDRGGRSRFPRVDNFKEPLFDNVDYIDADEFSFIGSDIISHLEELYYADAPPAHARLVMQKRIANYDVELYKQLAWDRKHMSDSADVPLNSWRDAWSRNANEQCALNKWCAVFSDDPANWYRPLIDFGVVE